MSRPRRQPLPDGVALSGGSGGKDAGMPLTMQQLADRLQLSIGTVSRALADDQAIAVATRARVVEAARRYGYEPNTAARSLSTGRTRIIGIQLSAFSSFFTEMALRLERLLANDGYVGVVHAHGTRIASWRPDGEIILDAVLPEQVGRRVPQVGSGPHPTADYVDLDFETPTRQAVRLLHETGCRRIAAVITPRPGSLADGRLRGYLAEMAALQLPPLELELGDSSYGGVRAAVAGFLAREPAVDALLCHNDDVAIGAFRAILDAGRRIPEDISLIGADGVEIGGYLSQPLSTIVQPLDERARTYWRFLSQRLEQIDLPQQSAVLRAELLLRATTRTPSPRR
jgi:DNA-binding LacI/PurR family transcriptional regulator